MIATNLQQEEAEDEMDVDYTCDDLSIGCNVSYLLDALAAIESDCVKITFHNSNTGMIIEDPADPDVLFVVMPMLL